MDREPLFLEMIDSCIKYATKIFVQFIQEQNYVKQIILWVGAITGYLLGSDSYELLIILLVMIVIDWVTGIRAAFKSGEKIKSSVIGRTAEKIIGYFALIIVAKLFGTMAHMEGLQKLVIAFYIAKEAYSIVENAKKMGIPVPAVFEKAIEGKLREDNSSELKNK